jgi:predicted dehydrogenase
MRVGIIGCGQIGQRRAKVAAAQGHKVAVLADVDLARAQTCASGFDGATACENWREVLAAKVDAVIVATPHNLLAPIALAAIESGAHVLVEKPAAREPDELIPLILAAERKAVSVKVGFNHRFHPAIRKAREIVDAGALGPLLYVRGRYGHGGRLEYGKEWRCNRHISGGGELIDQGSHLIDLSRWFLGELTHVFSLTPTYFWNISVEDNCFVGLKTPAGQFAWLHASWTEWKNLFCFEIFGKDGKLQIDGLGGSYGTERLSHYRMLPAMGPPETTIWEYPLHDKSWDLEFEDFTQAIVEKRRPEGDIYDAKANLEIIKSIYSSKGQA